MSASSLAVTLAVTLAMIRAHDTDYAVREPLVWKALALAREAGYDAGVRLDPLEPAWPVVFIELPMPDGSPGQVSWHQPGYAGQWDGHDAAEKYRRVEAYFAQEVTR